MSFLAIDHFVVSYGTMCILGRKHPTIFGKYAHWMRVQIFVWYSCCLDAPFTEELIWINAAGSFLTTQFLYLITGGKWLDHMASDLVNFVYCGKKNTRIIFWMIDVVIEGIPVLFALKVLSPGSHSNAPCYLWLITAVPHAMFGYILTGQFDFTKLRGTSMQEFNRSDAWVGACVFAGHSLAYLLLFLLI
jgi:hypothetical protein